MSLTYDQELQKRHQDLRAYAEALKSIAPRLLSACTPENRRAGRTEAYTMPAELNAEIHAIYERFGRKYQQGAHSSWFYGVAMCNTSEYLDSFSINHYGRNADKFYLIRFTKAQSDEMIRALENAAEELDKE